ncbi:hypothetical protein [Tomitella cavernea]|uniref:Glycine-rich domain-containing protein n=1 Tax=Tomitella cavernea TaxID=1387982 RepID=A0ABP9CEW7_9ACTN|nr:hypothetical protein [Tomitella cavernea]
MTTPQSIRYYQSNVVTFIFDDTYYKPANLVSIVVYLQGAGGGGGTQGGGGGGATVVSPRLFAAVLPDQVPVVVGASAAGQPGGDTSFGDLTAPGGQPGTPEGTGQGGVSPWRGGRGSSGAGESVSNQPIGNLAGCGGGGTSGGVSGGDYRNGFHPLWPGWFQAGRGGSTGRRGESPGGGGGIGATVGGPGRVTIIETLVIEEG